MNFDRRSFLTLLPFLSYGLTRSVFGTEQKPPVLDLVGKQYRFDLDLHLREPLSLEGQLVGEFRPQAFALEIVMSGIIPNFHLQGRIHHNTLYVRVERNGIPMRRIVSGPIDATGVADITMRKANKHWMPGELTMSGNISLVGERPAYVLYDEQNPGVRFAFDGHYNARSLEATITKYHPKKPSKIVGFLGGPVRPL